MLVRGRCEALLSQILARCRPGMRLGGINDGDALIDASDI